MQQKHKVYWPTGTRRLGSPRESNWYRGSLARKSWDRVSASFPPFHPHQFTCITRRRTGWNDNFWVKWGLNSFGDDHPGRDIQCKRGDGACLMFRVVCQADIQQKADPRRGQYISAMGLTRKWHFFFDFVDCVVHQNGDEKIKRTVYVLELKMSVRKLNWLGHFRQEHWSPESRFVLSNWNFGKKFDRQHGCG